MAERQISDVPLPTLRSLCEDIERVRNARLWAECLRGIHEEGRKKAQSLWAFLITLERQTLDMVAGSIPPGQWEMVCNWLKEASQS